MISNFDIRNFEELLTPSGKNDGKYICPICGGNNFSISDKLNDFGVPDYSCWNGCERSAIKEKLSPKKQWLESLQSNSTQSDPAPQLKLPRLPEPVESPQPYKEGVYTKTRYWYSDIQFVERVEFEGLGKNFYPHYLDDSGKEKTGMGKLPWSLYCINEVEEHGCNQWIPFVEGEKCVELFRQLGIVSTTAQGSKYTNNLKPLINYTQDLKDLGVKGIPIFQDNDETGRKKALQVAEAAKKVGLPYVVIDLVKLYPECPKGGDIVDYWEAMKKQGWSEEQFIERLEREIHEALNRKQQEEKQKVEAVRQKLKSQDGLEEVKTTVDETVLISLFDDREGNWATINSAYYYYIPDKGFWEVKTDDNVQFIISQHLRKLYRIELIDTDGGQLKIKKYKFATNNNSKSSFEFCRKSLLRQCKDNRHLIAFRNGTLDITSMSLIPHNKENLLDYCIDADYVPNSECPELFKKFIHDSFGEELLELIRAVFSMYLDPLAPYGYFVHLVGSSGSGKGVFIDFLESLFHENNIADLPSFADLADRDKLHQNLTGKRLVAFSDLGGFQKKLESFYNLVDNAMMSGRALFSSTSYSKYWYVRFIVASVELLKIENSKDGWDRRALLIPTKPLIGERDTTLKSRLKKECKAGVISWALSMDKERRNYLIQNAAKELESIRKLKNLQTTSGDSTKAFIDDCLRPSLEPLDTTTAFISLGELYENYLTYCKATGVQSFSAKRFNSSLQNTLCNLDSRLFKDTRGKTLPDATGKRTNIPKGYRLEFNPGIFNKGDFATTCNLDYCAEGGLQEIEDYVKGKLPTKPESVDPVEESPVEPIEQIPLPSPGDWIELQPYNGITGTHEPMEQVFVVCITGNTFHYTKKNENREYSNYPSQQWRALNSTEMVMAGLERGKHRCYHLVEKTGSYTDM